jgi:hypothetical protein
MTAPETRNAYVREDALWLRSPMPDTASAATSTLDVSGYMAVQIVGFVGTLATSAVVANRRPFVQLTSGIGWFWINQVRDPVQAGETRSVQFYNGTDEERDNSSVKFVPLSMPIMESPGAIIAGVSGGQAGDTFGPLIVWYRGWRVRR